MCDFGLTAMAMSVASQAANVGAQRQQAKAQEAAQNQASLSEMERFQLSQRADRGRQSDEETTAALEREKARREETEGIATTITSAEEAGVSGTSVGLAVDEYARKNAEYQAALSLQERMNTTARRLGFESAGNAYVNRMTQINQPIEQPNYLGAALGMGQSIVGGVSGFKQQTATEKLMTQQRELIGLQTQQARQGLKITQQDAYNTGASLNAAKTATEVLRQQGQNTRARRLFDITNTAR
jgi:hypothetical protein